MAGFTVEYGFMAEPSLLCVNCFKPPPEGRAKWQSCVRCAKLKLPATYYCSEECQTAHWPKHKQYHKEQRALIASVDMVEERSTANEVAQIAEAKGDECVKSVAQANTLMAEGNLHGAAKAWRKIIETWPEDAVQSVAYDYLAATLHRSCRFAEAAECKLKAMELYEEDTKDWAKSAAFACKMLVLNECHDVRKPEWWNEEAIKTLSARIMAAIPDNDDAQLVRALALSGSAGLSWGPGTRTAVELKEAATLFRRACVGADNPFANEWDEAADQMLAEEEVKAAATRAAAETEAAATRKAAEDKAAAAAEELLAEEEKEKQQTGAGAKAGKKKQVHGKGKKGQGQGKR